MYTQPLYGLAVKTNSKLATLENEPLPVAGFK